MATQENESIYTPEFGQLNQGQTEEINAVEDVMQSKLEISVEMGSTREKISRIINLKEGDVIVLDKHVEEGLDINVNGKKIASGESIIIDNKLAIRLSNINME
ncbi:MAG: FliM/FliN family flagellar motor switch protein [Peptostreptococcaceae bacterium]